MKAKKVFENIEFKRGDDRSIHQKLGVGADQTHDDVFPISYWVDVSKELSKLLNKPVTVLDIDISKYHRDIVFDVDGYDFNIYHNWMRDGSASKPITELTWDHEKDVTLGRYAIWDEPESYAEDLKLQIERLLEDEDEDDW